MGGPLCLSSFLAVAWILYTNAYTPVVDLHNSDPEFRDAMFAGNFSSEHQEKILSFAKSFINKY
jgi:hypothetical protein